MRIDPLLQPSPFRHQPFREHSQSIKLFIGHNLLLVSIRNPTLRLFPLPM